MFEDNWFLFLLIVMIAFAADGAMSERELAIMLAILFALTLTNNQGGFSGNAQASCFCNRSANS